ARVQGPRAAAIRGRKPPIAQGARVATAITSTLRNLPPACGYFLRRNASWGQGRILFTEKRRLSLYIRSVWLRKEGNVTAATSHPINERGGRQREARDCCCSFPLARVLLDGFRAGRQGHHRR